MSRPSPSFLAFLGALPGAGKTHSICARLQFLHGFVLSHFTLRFLQVTQLRGLSVRPCESIWPFVGPAIPSAVFAPSGDSSASSNAFSDDGGKCVRKSDGAEGANWEIPSLLGVCFWPSEEGVSTAIALGSGPVSVLLTLPLSSQFEIIFTGTFFRSMDINLPQHLLNFICTREGSFVGLEPRSRFPVIIYDQTDLLSPHLIPPDRI